MNCPIPKSYRWPLAIVFALVTLFFLAHAGVADASHLGLAGMGLAGIGSTQMTPGQARVVDPILTEVARGYKNAEMVGHALFPVVPVSQRGGQIIEFGKEDFKLYNTARAPGSNTKRVQFGHSGKPFALAQNALEGLVPFETMDDASQVPGIDMARVAIMKTQAIVALGREKAMADLATNAANYAASNKLTLSGTDQWSDLANSDPIDVIEAGKEAVRSRIGRYPNTMTIGAAVMTKLKQHPKIIERIKYTGRDVPTRDLLAALFGVPRLEVGEAVYADDAGDFHDVWGKSVVLAYTDTSGLADMGVPSYGYDYQLRGYPMVEQPYQDRSAKSWVYPITEEDSPVIAGADAGYLISNAVA